MSQYVHKSHNVSVLLYHIVYPAKYRRAIFSEHVDRVLKDVCLDIAARYEIVSWRGADSDHVHFLVQSVPMYSHKKIVQTIKSITAREIFRRCPEVKKQLWGGQLWTDGYFISTVGEHGDEDMIAHYVRRQGSAEKYQKFHKQKANPNQPMLL